MAKSQMRSSREARKPKAVDKKTKVSKYKSEDGMKGGKPAPLEIRPKK